MRCVRGGIGCTCIRGTRLCVAHFLRGGSGPERSTIRIVSAVNPMKPYLACFLLVGAVASACGQAPPKVKPVSPLAEYAGEWTSVFEGKVWLRLQLALRGEQMTGSLVHPKDITMNDNGELKSVSEEESTEKVTDAVVNPDGLLLTFNDAETQKTDRYMMRVILPDKITADLKMIGMPMAPGMAKPKPWRLAKSASAPVDKAATPR
jgi:hypothetical protein